MSEHTSDHTSDRTPRLALTHDALPDWDGDCLVVGLYEGVPVPEPLRQHAGPALADALQALLDTRWLRGKAGETTVLPAAALAGTSMKARHLMVVGLGKPESLKLETLRSAGGHMVRAAMQKGFSRLLCAVAPDAGCIPWPAPGAIPPRWEAELAALAEGAQLACYRFLPYYSTPPDDDNISVPGSVPGPEEIVFVAPPAAAAQVAATLVRTVAVVRGVFLARDLGNHPGNIVTPDYLAQTAIELGSTLPITTTVFDEKELAARNMGGILGVGQGSVHPPRLITMTYRQGGDAPPLVVVGKGITFDSGGISLKPGLGMEDMKMDMSGAAAVFGIMRAVAELRWPVNLIGIVPTAENLPGGNAQRPGDIIRTAKGIFVEVINTDAEGRLILADALHHAEQFQPAAIVDLATLTGACVIALGSVCSGLLGNDEALIQALRQAGDQSGERVWPLPLYPEYQEALKSTCADMKNVGDREAGTITAACFLSRFVEKQRPWAHIDIAGTAMDSKGTRSYVRKGCVGYGVRLLCQLIEDRYLSTQP